MKKTLLPVFLFLPVILLAQGTPNLDHLMTERLLTCEEVAMNCQILLPGYYARLRFDSIRMVLSYWRSKCGSSEAIDRMDVLLNLKERRFSEVAFGEQLFNLVRAHGFS